MDTALLCFCFYAIAIGAELTSTKTGIASASSLAQHPETSMVSFKFNPQHKTTILNAEAAASTSMNMFFEKVRNVTKTVLSSSPNTTAIDGAKNDICNADKEQYLEDLILQKDPSAKVLSWQYEKLCSNNTLETLAKVRVQFDLYKDYAEAKINRLWLCLDIIFACLLACFAVLVWFVACSPTVVKRRNSNTNNSTEMQ